MVSQENRTTVDEYSWWRCSSYHTTLCACFFPDKYLFKVNSSRSWARGRHSGQNTANYSISIKQIKYISSIRRGSMILTIVKCCASIEKDPTLDVGCNYLLQAWDPFFGDAYLAGTGGQQKRIVRNDENSMRRCPGIDLSFMILPRSKRVERELRRWICQSFANYWLQTR